MKHHYRYVHAANRMYLPTDVSVASMYRDFVAEKGDRCSYETYRKAVREQNIAFTPLSGEECTKCSLQLNHLQDFHHLGGSETTQHVEGCTVCAAHAEHMRHAREARESYRADADREWSADELTVSADMMKVTVLPIIPFNEAIFTSRLICYNETFSTVMPTERASRSARKTLQKTTSACVLWHEALAGRSAEEVAAAYFLYLETVCRDFKTVVIWADNCAAQNKCWVLLSTLLKVVHSPKTSTDRITVKYFEAGHTAMSADAVHQIIKKSTQGASRRLQ